jgi:hypothetical protein
MLSTRNLAYHFLWMTQQGPSLLFVQFIIKDVSTIWKGPNWESFLLRLLNVRAMFKVIDYICNYESFKSLLTTVCKSTFVTKIQFEFGKYMAKQIEVLGSLMTLLNIHVLIFAYLFPCKIGTNLCAKILGNKKLRTLVEMPKFFFSIRLVAILT